MFYMLMLEQDITKKERVSKKVLELDASDKNSKEYKVKAIWDSIVYANKSDSDYLPDLYYLVV